MERTPIKLPPDIKAHLRLRELQEQGKDKTIMGLILHYNMLARQWTKRTGYSAVDFKNPKLHNNWKYFEALWEICRMKDWDAKLYLDVQFKVAKSLPRGLMPKPVHLYTHAALMNMTNHLADMRQKHKHDTNKAEKERGSTTKGVREEVIDEVISSVELLDYYIQRTTHDNLEEYKALYIHQNWLNLSPFYLWTIPWFHDILPDLQGRKVSDYVEDFDTIRRSESLQRLIAETVQRVEKHYNIPGNLTF